MNAEQMLAKLRSDSFEAIKNKDTVISGIAQMAMSAIKNAQIASDKELTPEQVVEALRKEAKKLQDGIDQFSSYGEKELVEEYTTQLNYLNQFLPALMGEDQVREAVKAKIASTGAQSVRDMGRVMGAVMGELAGKADGNLVKKIVSELLS